VRVCAPHLDKPFDLKALAAFANAAAADGFDTLLLEAADGFEPIAAAAALAPLTRTIKLAAVASTDRGEPYTLARAFAALDHLSGGRAIWVPSGSDAARQQEFIDVAVRLWESWQADAFIFDKANAIFSDPAKAHRINHAGAAFQVRGPLNTPRPPQGRIPILRVADLSITRRALP